jgi:hypothetical protein
MATDFWKDYEPEPHKGLSEHIAQATNGRVRIDPVTGDVGIGTPPAAQRQWVGLTDDEILKLAYPIRWQEVDDFEADKAVNFAQAIEAKLKEKNDAAQPAVPDAIHHTDLSEHPQYIQGWNDCRQAMLEMMK